MVLMSAFCILPASRISRSLSGACRRRSSSPFRRRSRISWAAASVKVMTSSSDRDTGSSGSVSRSRMCSTSTAVLPEPAAAATRRFPSRCRITFSCSSVHCMPIVFLPFFLFAIARDAVLNSYFFVVSSLPLSDAAA